MEQLTKKEEEIMQIIWQIGRAFVKDVIDKLPPPGRPYSTVSSVVRILEKKGFLGYKAYGKTHEYYPLVSKDEYRKFYLKGVIKDYFENSYKSVLSFFAKEEKINEEELKEIIQLIKSKQDQNEN
ncbi:MAG: BlaI/MecI/CopY family transcriptional regulator [Cytophagales bacterium]|nr:BlaI/MecI/CopY family transcriptional regulator [Cytophagales bacterium]